MNELKFSSREVGKGIYAVTAVMGEQIYLVLGENKALLIDTGLGIGSLFEEISRITKLPILVINTHGHPDHGGGNGEFEEILLHKKDYKLYMEMCTEDYRRNDIELQLGTRIPEQYNNALQPLNANIKFIDCDSIELGNRLINIYDAPGHTAGSICLYDHNSGSLFTGDNVSLTDTWLYLNHCQPVEVYVETLKKMISYADYTQLLPGHPPTPVIPSVIEAKMKCALEIIKDPLIGIPVETFAGKGLRHIAAGVSILYDPDNVYKK